MSISVSRLAACALLAGVVASPCARAADQVVDALLLDVEGEQVKLNKGKDQGVQVGQVYDLYREARVYMLPLTNGEVPLVHTQERVARVVVSEAEGTTARALVVVRDQKDGAPLPIERGLIAVHNPTAVAPNRPPVFSSTPQLAPVPWRARQELKLAVSNEADDAVVYTWRATGGKLDHERTLLPSNTWTAPPAAGSYRITVEARDGAGNVQRTAFAVASSGLEGGARFGALRASPRTIAGPGRYAMVRDVAFDRVRTGPSRRYTLDVGVGWGAEPAVVVEQPERQQRDWSVRLPVVDHDFTALAASNPSSSGAGALYALDATTKTVLRYEFGVEWGQVLKRPPDVIGEPDGGTGNARFQEPVDLALAPDGEVYVLDAGQRSVQAFSHKGAFLVSFGRPGTRPLELQRPRALAVGSDSTVYVLDDGRKAVVMFRGWRAVGEIVVGAPEDELVGVAVDPFTSNVFVLDRAAGAVRQYTRDGRLVGRLGGEAGSAAQLLRPTRVRVDPGRVVWVLDRDGAALARFDGDGEFLGRMQTVELPAGVKIAGRPGGGVAVLDRSESKVLCFDDQGWMTARFGSRGEKPGDFADPMDLAVASTGDIFVLDAERRQLLRFSPQGAFLDAVGRPGDGPNELTGVMDLASVNDRSYVVVTQQRNESNFNLFEVGTGRSDRAWGTFTGEMTPRFGCVTGVTGRLDPRREGARPHSAPPFFWFADEERERIFRVKFSEVPTAPLALELDEVGDLEALPTGHVVVADGGKKVLVLNPDGSLGSALASSARLERPTDLGVDDFGRVYAFDGSKRRIAELTDTD